MHHVVDTPSPLEGTFSYKKQIKVVQPKCSIDESTSRLYKDNALYHRKLKADMAQSVHSIPLWSETITSEISNKRGESLLMGEVKLSIQSVNVRIDSQKWYVGSILREPCSRDKPITPTFL